MFGRPTSARAAAIALLFDSRRGELATPYSHLHVPDTPSTQDAALAEFERGGGGPVVVSADRQSAGRGRTSRTWWSAPRALAVSVAVDPSDLHPGWDTRHQTLIPLLGGLAAATAIADERLRLKWPNDLEVDGAKIGGILTEATRGTVVVGCGVNLWWPDPPDGVAALRKEDPGPDAGRPMAIALAEDLVERIARGPSSWDREAYLAVSSTVGAVISWSAGGVTSEGAAVDIDSEGGLVVEAPGGRVILRSGEVRTVRPATVTPLHRDGKGHGY